jgi:hypothetical protein
MAPYRSTTEQSVSLELQVADAPFPVCKESGSIRAGPLSQPSLQSGSERSGARIVPNPGHYAARRRFFHDLAGRYAHRNAANLAPNDQTSIHRLAERYFRAGGGEPSEFNRLWAIAVEACQRVAAALQAGKEHQAGGSVFYLISGRKPR